MRIPKEGKTLNAVKCNVLKDILMAHACEMEPEEYLRTTAAENKPRMKKLVYATWRTIVKDANLPSDMSPNDCRLTHINIIEKLVPEVATTTLKGHVDPCRFWSDRGQLHTAADPCSNNPTKRS